MRPQLLVIVDAEEAFDWRAPFSRTGFRVDTSATQGRSCRIFQSYGIRPTYVVDFPVALEPSGHGPLLELMQAGLCDVGAQLHPWVTPPYNEALSEEASYANNLAPDLERQKIVAVKEAIEVSFGIAPQIYRAGRYGAGLATLSIIEDLGFKIDCSVLPGMRLAPAAPDYSQATAEPYWLGKIGHMLEIPVTVGTVGFAGKTSEQIYRGFASPWGRKLRLPAIAARLRVAERIRLTPEGTTVEEAKRLTRKLLKGGNRVFVVSYHSPSLSVGNTPYVRNEEDLERFLSWLDEYFAYFVSELGGTPSTPFAVLEMAKSQRADR